MHPSSSTDDADGMAEAEALVESSLPLLFSIFDDAVAAGIVEPVLFLVDCEDDLGAELSRAWVGDEAVDDAIVLRHESIDQPNETTVFARGVPWDDCRREAPEVFPYLAPAFSDRPPSDGFLVVAVTCGGAAALTIPADARP